MLVLKNVMLMLIVERFLVITLQLVRMLEIMEDSVPDGSVQGATSFGGTGWGGPCPHSGVHRYFFKLYALDATLDLAPDSNKATLEAAMDGHVFAQCELVGRYSRKQ